MTEPFPPPGSTGDQAPSPGPPAYGYQQYGYGYGLQPQANYSGFWRRFLAALLDGFIVGSVGALLSGATGGSSAVGLINVVIGVAYYAYLEGTRGQTVGKMAVGVRVVDVDTGEMIGIARGIGRYFARILSGLALGLGYLWMLWDPRKQTWHDKLARSIVIRTL
jgi:uncharacterized RDD family membrane protein YckC